jgi:hypothetical protein
VLIDAGIFLVGFDPREGPLLDLHGDAPLHWECAGGSEMRSAAPAIQGGGQADQGDLPLIQ